MSRIGKQPVKIPDGVHVTLKANCVHVKGPKGEVEQVVHPDMRVKIDEKARKVVVERASDSALHKAIHGTTRALLNNMVRGVVEPFEKRLEIVGTGYSMKVEGGKTLIIQCGFSHAVKVTVPAGIAATNPNPTSVSLHSSDRRALGEFAAYIRRIKPPEPYNLKGIKYGDEVIKQKTGKTFVSGA